MFYEDENCQWIIDLMPWLYTMWGLEVIIATRVQIISTHRTDRTQTIFRTIFDLALLCQTQE